MLKGLLLKESLTVQIRCEQRSQGLTRRWTCEIDRGGGWQPLPVP